MTQFEYENAVQEIKCRMNAATSTQREQIRLKNEQIRVAKNEIRKLQDEVYDLKSEVREIEMQIHDIRISEYAKIDELRVQYHKDNGINV